LLFSNKLGRFGSSSSFGSPGSSNILPGQRLLGQSIQMIVQKKISLTWAELPPKAGGGFAALFPPAELPLGIFCGRFWGGQYIEIVSKKSGDLQGQSFPLGQGYVQWPWEPFSHLFAAAFGVVNTPRLYQKKSGDLLGQSFPLGQGGVQGPGEHFSQHQNPPGQHFSAALGEPKHEYVSNDMKDTNTYLG
jgi:hypothetical protein